MAGTNIFGGDWWGDVLGRYEPAQYYSSPAGLSFAAKSPRKGRYFRDSYQDVLKDYYGQAGTSMRQGREPVSFMDYLETNKPWSEKYAALPQSARSRTGQASRPQTKYLFNF